MVFIIGADQNHFDPKYFEVGQYWGLPNIPASEIGYKKKHYISLAKETYQFMMQLLKGNVIFLRRSTWMTPLKFSILSLHTLL